MNLEADPWTDLANAKILPGQIEAIGRMPRGTTTGHAAVAFRIKALNGYVIAQTTLHLFEQAGRAMRIRDAIERPRDPHPTDTPISHAVSIDGSVRFNLPGSPMPGRYEKQHAINVPGGKPGGAWLEHLPKGFTADDLRAIADHMDRQAGFQPLTPPPPGEETPQG